MIIYRFREDMVYDCEVEVPDGTVAIQPYHTFQPPPEKEGHYAVMRGGWFLIKGEKPAWPPIPPEPILEELKYQKIQQLAEYRWAREEGGTILNGVNIPTDRHTQSKFASAYVKAINDSSYTIQKWKFSNELFMTLDSSTIIEIANAIEYHVQACFYNEALISDRISNCTSKEDLDQVDLNDGWPHK